MSQLVRKATDDDDVFLSAGSSRPASQASRHVEKEDIETLADEGKMTPLTAASPVVRISIGRGSANDCQAPAISVMVSS
ncbi:MAG: hypothetical protein ACPIOQ_59070 [Promethearchaeia archaeon]